MASSFKIGTSQETLTALDELDTPVDAPEWSFADFMEEAVTGDGGSVGLGSPVVVWLFTLPEQDMRNELKSFCAGKSAEVYISTCDNAGDFHDYSATLNWPASQERAAGNVANLELTFRNLVELEPLA